MEEKKNLLTYAGLKKLEEELHDLKVVKRKEVAEKIKEAREQGDLSENAEYDAAKDEQRDIEARIEEIEKIDAIQNQIKQYVELPAVTSGMIMKNSQYAISFALMGIGGVMIKESKMNLKTASKNKAMASAVTAQIDSICIALEGITQHTMIITELLEKLGMLYMKSIKNISIILKNNGLDSENYSEDDINALNVSLSLTKLIYRIINTPLLDENGNIEKESIKVIQQGRDMLKQIQ